MMPVMDRWEKYEHLRFERPSPGVLLITIDRPERHNATNAVLHSELTNVWKDVDADPQTMVAVITGAGKTFCPGGDVELLEVLIKDWELAAATAREAQELVTNMIDCPKVIISAINGAAVGAGLAVALMADISVIAEEARITDGHTRIGVVAGDHAAVVWPLLCGMAKAKYLLLTAKMIDGREAERLGLVSLCEPQDNVLPAALEVASDLAQGPQHAIRWTKRTLNHWLNQARPAFDASTAYEMLAFLGPDAAEGVKALGEKRPPRFPSAAGD
ncbi:MAG: enoyl-CoA hydratase [Thermoleophilaceae bacterium]|jgi:enoyl-CoA hydratase|nr:enoyl-CoA hydratase [Thermoleophilaceae bacterium]